VDAAHRALRPFAGLVKITYLQHETVEDLVAAVRTIPPRSVLLYFWFGRAGPSTTIYSYQVARRLAEAAPVPMYGMTDEFVGIGVVGGVVRRTQLAGVRLAEMALQIVTGTPARDIPVEAAPVAAVVDWRQVERWGIDASQLPPDTDVRFRTPTAWEAYPGQVVTIVVVVAAQLLLIAALLAQRTRRRRAERVLRNHEATLRRTLGRIRRLAGRVINAEEAARATIARDLHDGVGQELVGVAMAVSALRQAGGRVSDRGNQSAILGIQALLLGMVDGMRRLSHDLHPATLRLLGLGSALKAHCAEVRKRHGVRIELRIDGDLGYVRPEAALCLFRIAQEAIRNGIAHGGAPRIDVTVRRSGDQIELTVLDEGRGFDVDLVRDGGGLGLVSMEERALLVGGRVDVVSQPQQGTVIRASVPAGVPEVEAARDLVGA
jgi:signal transduction histidine kinase